MIIDRILGISTVVVLTSTLMVSTSVAEVEYDGSISGAGFVPGPNYIIDSSFGRQSGRNLFHSFKNFNIGGGENAKFVGPAEVSHIFARVTSGNSSVINGLVASDIEGASLWVINPKGIIFGQGAALDISGSFYATTADYITFEDGRFDSTPVDSFTLPSGVPARIEMLSDNQASVHVNNSNLENDKSKGIHLVSNNVSLINARLDAGRITLDASGLIENIAIEYPGEQEAADRLTVIDSTLLSHGSLQMDAGDIVLDGAHIDADGKLKIYSESLVLRNSEVLMENAIGSIDFTSTSLSFENVEIESINAGDNANIEVRGDVISLSETSVRSYAGQDVKGSDINIAGHVVMLSGGKLLTESDGSGVSGDIGLKAQQELHIDGTELRTRGVGLKGGYIYISAEGQLNYNDKNFTTEYPQAGTQQVTRIQIGVATEDVIPDMNDETEAQTNAQTTGKEGLHSGEGQKGITETGRDQLLLAVKPVRDQKLIQNKERCKSDGEVNIVRRSTSDNDTGTWRYPMGRYVSFSTFQGGSNSDNRCL